MIQENTYLDEMAKQYIEETTKFLNQDKYISKKQYDRLLDKYEDLFSNIKHIENPLSEKLKTLSNNVGTIIESHNNKYIEDKLIEYKDYFDHMFDYIDTAIKLDEEQRKAILIDEDYSLVIAGAGSGKTTT